MTDDSEYGLELGAERDYFVKRVDQLAEQRYRPDPSVATAAAA